MSKTPMRDAWLAKFQNENCKGCRFANDKRVGTGKPCCIYPGRLLTTPDKCLTRLGGKE